MHEAVTLMSSSHYCRARNSKPHNMNEFGHVVHKEDGELQVFSRSSVHLYCRPLHQRPPTVLPILLLCT
jgi:hypothetical protein